MFTSHSVLKKKSLLLKNLLFPPGSKHLPSVHRGTSKSTWKCSNFTVIRKGVILHLRQVKQLCQIPKVAGRTGRIPSPCVHTSTTREGEGYCYSGNSSPRADPTPRTQMSWQLSWYLHRDRCSGGRKQLANLPPSSDQNSGHLSFLKINERLCADLTPVQHLEILFYLHLYRC